MNNLTATWPAIEKLKKYRSSGDIDSEIIELLNLTLTELNRGIFIFGTGKLGQKIHGFLSSNSFPISGYVDNNKSVQGKIKDNTMIFGIEALSKDSIVYIASETYVNPIFKQLKEMGITKVISPIQGSILFKLYSNFPIDNHFQNLTEDIILNKERYLKVFSLLSDGPSRKVFDSLINYRLTGDLNYIDNIETPSELEYFDNSVIKLSETEVFFDCGGYTGDSTQNFINFSAEKYRSVHIFEPDKNLLSKAKKRLAEFKNVYYSDSGIFDKSTTIYFDSTGGSDGSIGDSGNLEITTIALDEYQCAEIPTYIKLDIEGVEIEALNGAEKTIRNHRPKLAIASYHFPKHFWEVPLHTLGINPGYNLHLRHYSNCIFGSTYYFLPI